MFRFLIGFLLFHFFLNPLSLKGEDLDFLFSQPKPGQKKEAGGLDSLFEEDSKGGRGEAGGLDSLFSSEGEGGGGLDSLFEGGGSLKKSPKKTSKPDPYRGLDEYQKRLKKFEELHVVRDQKLLESKNFAASGTFLIQWGREKVNPYFIRKGEDKILKATELHPDELSLALHAGEILIQRGRFDEAHKILAPFESRENLRQFPLLFARLFTGLGRFQLALITLKNGLTPNTDDDLRLAFFLNAHLGKISRGVELLKAHPHLFGEQSHLVEGLILFAAHRFSECKKILGKYLLNFPQDSLALYFSGLATLHQDGKTRALPYYQKIIRLDPERGAFFLSALLEN